MYEHRLVLETKLGRYLTDREVVDHVDGLHLHNDPSNLRLFDSNAAHLKATITGQIPKWSEAGFANMQIAKNPSSLISQVDTYGQMKKNGDARLRQILLCLLTLGKDSPFLSGSSHHLEKAGIFDLSHSNLERVLVSLSQKYA
jgi:hypothetical protein